MSRVLIVDDEESICWALRRLVTEEGHQVEVASSAEEGLSYAAVQPPDLVLLDVRLPGLDGLSAMEQFRALSGPAPIVVMTAFGSLDTAVRALANGAFEYLIKPFDLDQAAAVVSRALALAIDAASSDDGDAPPTAQQPDDGPSDEMIGSSPAMQEVFKRIALVARSDASVLITGESGTGKELVARAIHRHSHKALAPLVPVNLAALSPTLVESELFGHVRGAYTGAAADRRGLLELADGGTVFFDEAADIPMSVQVKLLRVLEQQEVTPVGDTRPRTSAFRVLTASNRDLRAAVRRGAFREDLYFRLAVFEIALPPLRGRVEDIPLLAERFLRRARNPQCAAGPHPRGAHFTAAAVHELCARPWPGNVRELRNAVEHAVILARGGPIEPLHLPPHAASEPHEPSDDETIAATVRRWAECQFESSADAEDLYVRLLGLVEPPLLEVALRKHHGQRVSAARSLGLHRTTLRKKLAQYAPGAG
jgi:DNA-binding NtrC family response regulator